MDRDRWKRVDALLDGALDRPKSERTQWLVEACDGDDALHAEVAKLLELAEREDDLLRPEGVFASPIGEEVARELSKAGGGARAVHVGDSLGTYRLVELLGKGGQGRVYAAEDSKLGRRIALKLLPPEMASAERRKRFDREAKAIAALNHPNIVHVYTIEEANGIAFLTMELVSGETLGERIPPSGLPLKTLFHIAIPVVDALASAHERGVVHRDLKPGNVMIDEDGRIKILDFGLAKLAAFGGGAADSGEHPLSATQEGHILGTISYMSPEQAEGKFVDHRTDIFSLGVLLYEMSTGRLPFTGETPTAILSAIIKDTPAPVTDLNPGLPHELSRIIKRCLIKDPERRYQTAADVRIELEELEYALDSRKLFHPAVDRESSGGPGVILLGVVAAGVAMALAAYLMIWGEGRSADLMEGNFSQLTSDPGAELFPTLSPDGGFLVYASRDSGNWDIYLLRAGGRRPINLTEDSPADETQPAFSPDGTRIAFHSSRQNGGIFVMGATGESARRITDFGWNPAWSPDGRRLVFATAPVSYLPYDRPTPSALWTVQIDSGETRLLTEGDAVQPSWSPNGHRIAYWGLVAGGAQRDVYTLPATGGAPTPVTQDAALDWNPVWSPDGRYLYLASDRGGSVNLWRIPVDERSGRVLGEAEAVRAPATFAAHVSFSRDGSRMVYASMLTSLTLECRRFEPRSARAEEEIALARPVRNISGPRVSPDGGSIVYGREGIREDIVLAKIDGSDERLLTDDSARDRYPRWSPDGRSIAFYSNRGGAYEIWMVNRDGSELRQLTDIPEHPTRYPVFSPDGSRLLFSSPGTAGLLVDPHLLEPAKTAEELPPYPSEGEDFVPFDWSPDGKWLAGHLQSRAGVRSGVAVYSFETSRYQKLTDFGDAPHFLPDSRRILFQGLGPEGDQNQSELALDIKLFVVDRETGEFHEVLTVPGASIESSALSPDGSLLFFVRSDFEADIWMLSATGEVGKSAPTPPGGGS